MNKNTLKQAQKKLLDKITINKYRDLEPYGWYMEVIEDVFELAYIEWYSQAVNDTIEEAQSPEKLKEALKSSSEEQVKFLKDNWYM